MAKAIDRGREPLSYTPPVPDGPDRPWTRGRRTRWWLVVPADVLAVVVATALGAASTKTLPQWGSVLWGGGIGPFVGLLFGWLFAWWIGRRRQDGDHLEVPWPDGYAVSVWTFLGWLTAQRNVGGGWPGWDWFLMAAVLLAVALEGWRWLYGYVKAHDSMVPKPVQRRLDEQAAAYEKLDGESLPTKHH
ncbi:DUF3054 domain-containing protein [Actinomyces trachealis]|uniref:DUF3054 domain-containing protein n=1 Tax=Actinomyces trachealis TaxID=2763540 RepID=UPI001892AA66|nr:DUF3054 domain-containing protein [Actinomyces trachealis]